MEKRKMTCLFIHISSTGLHASLDGKELKGVGLWDLQRIYRENPDYKKEFAKLPCDVIAIMDKGRYSLLKNEYAFPTQYLRTKIGDILELVDTKVEWNEALCDNETRWYVADGRYFLEDQVVSVSGDIDELIDAIVIRDGTSCHFLGYLAPSYIEERLKDLPVGIYGSVWVIGDDGTPTLKPVAKLKGILPKGEADWELL